MPGDIIEWVYRSNDDVVVPNEEMWSSVEKRWVPISGLALLIAVSDGVFTWLSAEGLFRARGDDMAPTGTSPSPRPVVPRARMT